MLTIFRKKTAGLLGIDIGPTFAKLLELKKVNGYYQVESCAVLPMPPSLVVDKSFKRLEEIGNIADQLVLRAQTSLRSAAVAVPDSSVITRTIQLEATLSESDIENQVAIEAEQYIPYPLEEVNMDFSVLGPSSKDPNQVDVLIVASRSEHVNARVQALAFAGVTTEIVDVESYAIERACGLVKAQLPNQGNDQVVAVVDLSKTMVQLIVLDNFKIVYTREEMIEQPFVDAGNPGLKAHSLIVDAPAHGQTDWTLFEEAVVLQLRRALQFFYSTTEYLTIDHLLLAGDSARVGNLTKTIAEQLAVPTTLVNPFITMRINNKIDSALLMQHAPAMLICCGLAMRSFVRE